MLPQTVICIGRSGSGKGTQVNLLVDAFEKKSPSISSIHLETGQFFRHFIEDTSLSAQLSKKVYLEGRRQPDFLAISMWGYILCKDYTGNQHLFFDGTPRSLAEAKIIEDALSFYERFDESKFGKPKVVFLDVPETWSAERMSERGRIDDKTKEQIDLRLSWFKEEVIPAIEFFRTNPKFDFIHIKGDQKISEVGDDIAKHFK